MIIQLRIDNRIDVYAEANYTEGLLRLCGLILKLGK